MSNESAPLFRIGRVVFAVGDRFTVRLPPYRWVCPYDGRRYRFLPKLGLCRSCRSSLRLIVR